MVDFISTGVVAGAPVGNTVRCVFGLMFGALLLGGCAAASVSLQELEYDPRLLTAETVFGSPVEVNEVPSLAMLETDDAMLAFIAEYVGEAKSASRRFERLLRGLSREGYFSETYSYDAGQTLTAAETFNKKTGNCLSYTTMFIALARSIELSAYYQIVDIPANWDAEGGYLIRYSHINLVIDDVNVDSQGTREVTVDFNAVEPSPQYSRWRISDQDATALFHSNRSVDHMVAGNARMGFAHLRKALQLMPNNADLWLNLGAFYAKQKQPQMAVLAHRVVLEMDSQNKSAMSGHPRNTCTT